MQHGSVFVVFSIITGLSQAVNGMFLSCPFRQIQSPVFMTICPHCALCHYRTCVCGDNLYSHLSPALVLLCTLPPKTPVQGTDKLQQTTGDNVLSLYTIYRTPTVFSLSKQSTTKLSLLHKCITEKLYHPPNHNIHLFIL